MLAKRGLQDDSSDEDEPISSNVDMNTNKQATSWMQEDEEDEEEEDVDWTQLSRKGKPHDISQTTPQQYSNFDATVLHTPKMKRALTNIDQDEWNTDAWLTMMKEIQSFPIIAAREYYEKFLTKFPTSAHWWRLYAEHELKENQYERVQEIIKKSLMQIRCPDVDLWVFYLNLTKVTKVEVANQSNDVEQIAKARQLMLDAYELAIERTGGSLYGSSIWIGYLNFLQEDQDPQAFLRVRKVFHRALILPQHNMDNIWRDYEKFERSIPNNDALAQNFFKLYRPKFDASKAVLKDRKKLYDPINLDLLAVPVNSSSGGTRMKRQMLAWQKVLAFEMENPERLDPIRLKQRVRFSFEVCLSCMRLFPEAWYHYASYEKDTNDLENAIQIFKKALEAIPDSSFLHFTLADLHELNENLHGAKQIYEKMLQDNSLVSSLAYVTYQRFARRALVQQKGLSEARKIFKRARKDKRQGACTYHVFAAAAMLEFYSDTSANNTATTTTTTGENHKPEQDPHQQQSQQACSGKEIALKIFELGLKRYIHEPAYVFCYLEFLGHLNDDKNMRSLFEKVLAVMPVEISRGVWDRYVDFEHKMVSNGGDLSTVAKVEARRALAFPEAPYVEMKGLLSVTHRYTFLDLKPPSSIDQAFLEMYGVGTTTLGSSSTLGGGQGTTISGVSALEEELAAEDAVFEGCLTEEELQNLPGPPLPDFLKPFACLLPLNIPWNGPLANVEQIYRSLVLVDFPPRGYIEAMELQQREAQAQYAEENSGASTGADATKVPPAASGTAEGNNGGGGSSSTEGGAAVVNKRPPNDVFRLRQKQKLAKIGL